MKNLGKFDEIPFKDLLEIHNDSNYIVMVAMKFREDGPGANEDSMETLNSQFHEIDFIKPECNVSGIHYITGNVLGQEGRHDYLIEVEGEKVGFNPMVRLQYGSTLKWLSDYVVNFRKDYHY